MKSPSSDKKRPYSAQIYKMTPKNITIEQPMHPTRQIMFETCRPYFNKIKFSPRTDSRIDRQIEVRSEIIMRSTPKK